MTNSSSSSTKLKALLKKNITIMLRNCCTFVAEILFPIILMLIIFAIRQAFKVKTHKFEDEESTDEKFFEERSTAYLSNNPISTEKWNKMTVRPFLKNCYDVQKPRNTIALINVPDYIKNRIEEFKAKSDSQFENMEFKVYESIEKMEDAVKDNSYGLDDEHPLICFGISFTTNEKGSYNYALHYFDSAADEGVQDIPDGRAKANDPFQEGPDMDSYKKFVSNGYNQIQRIIFDYISMNEEGITDNDGKTNPPFQINFGMMAMKYEKYRTDPFGAFVGYIVPFFIVIAYMCPLCLYVLRMVREKETKAKEGMKIMGMSESTYFLSYFIQFFVTNIFYSILNAIILNLVFKHVNYFIIFLTFFLWGLCVFSLAFFFQSFIDKTRVALILSLLIYFVMYFLSMAVMSDQAAKGLKIVLSIFPAIALELGIILFGYFESHFQNLKFKHVTKTYQNYAIIWMLVMLLIDFLLYLFLGYYLQNIISHEFGIAKPFYFLCTKSYWCPDETTRKNKKKKVSKILEPKEKKKVITNERKTQGNSNEVEGEKISLRENGSQPQSEIEYEHPENFQGEEIYADRTEKDDVMKVRNLVKKFDDGKVAVKGVSINFYKDEIFALLGHNGAGKTTMISMLCGMYEASEGEAYFDGMDILDGDNMDEFRQKLGICPQHDILFDDLNIKEHLAMFAIFKGVDSSKVDEEVEQTMKDFQLTGMADVIAKDLSAGQRRKLSIAISLIGGSQVIFLDEPSSGMDITSRRNLWDILKRISENKIIILTTHYMEEASVLGNRIGIINSGEMKCVGTPLFLVERYGRFMSLNITKEPSAHNQQIIDFVDELAKDIEYEILSEQIMFRIPKVNYSKEEGGDGFLEKFFQKLDENQEKLRIKSYTAAMPTLEDVFLNVAAEDILALKGGHRKFSQVNEENDRILFEQECREDYSNKSKFCNDFSACMTKRYYNTIRDSKGFLLEMLCPILLILIGLLVSKVKFKTHSDPFTLDINDIGEQTIYYGMEKNANGRNDFIFENNENITYKTLDISSSSSGDTAINEFYQKLYENADSSCFGAMYIQEYDHDNINFISFINTQATFGGMYFPYYFLTQVLKIKYPSVSITFTNHAMPLTAELESNAGQTSNSLIVFFVSVAFSLIPANFITIIVKERVNNSKHLMRISGMSFIAYWLTNYIYELIKYYITAGVCLLLIWAFDFYAKYFVIFYIIYGPSMITFTYIMSFWYDSETTAQNAAILLNFLIGALGSSVVLMFRGLENMKDFGHGLEFIFGFVPSFDLAYGYDVLLNKYMLLIAHYPDNWSKKAEDEKFMISMNYTGLQITYLILTFILYLIILIILERSSTHFSKSPNEPLKSNVKDPDVIKENKRAQGEIAEETKKEYAIQIQNLRKSYKKVNDDGCCCCHSTSEVKAVRNLSFCLEYGECFGLLGVNGAGKTTTFKCITNEHSQNNGKIFIDGLDISENFSKLSQVFGYCPQFDAIFEYMTVYENLYFYAKIKGIAMDRIDKIIDALIEEMSLSEFPNKIAGRLSGGNKRKLSVAISMICNPPIILLDEPSTGMDPEARRFMWAVIHKISTKRKKSSVIMTTHSMDEAETLCKRMGIMVNGEFVCLGGSNEIKEKYGYGFEADIRIKPLSDEMANQILKEKSIDPKLIVKPNNLNDTLIKLGKEQFLVELQKGRLGEKLLREVSTNERFRVPQLLAWTYFTENALKLIKKSKQYFEEIILTEYIDNNFLFKLKKGENSKSIGFLFGLFESIKDECYVTEYSIQPTSLEQIFNKFAAKQGHDEEGIEVGQEKTEILIDDELLGRLVK